MRNEIIPKKSNKQKREYSVLLGLVEHYLKFGKPVGSNMLKEAGFEDLSSATIRNYFANLEEQGYLTQQHASGGRIPTHLAYKAYAGEYLDSMMIPEHALSILEELRVAETREIAAYLETAAEKLSSLTNTAVFLSAPRFDQDYIVDLKVVPIDHSRCLCVIVTDFGMIRTEVLTLDTRLTAFAAKRIESYFHWRLTGHDQPEDLEPEEMHFAQRIYNEIVVRYVVSYTNFIDAELYRTGFSKLLSHPEYQDAALLATTLSLFENTHSIRLLIKECSKANQIKVWIGDDLTAYTSTTPSCSVIAIPYRINQNSVGVIGLVGSTRIPYKELFGILRAFTQNISEALTRNLYKFKITFRQPHSGPYQLVYAKNLIDQSKGEP